MPPTALDERAQAALPSRQIATGRRSGRRQKLPSIFDGQRVTCPRCRKQAPFLDFDTLPEMPVYQHETVPILRCTGRPERSCGFLFAPRISDAEARVLRENR